MTVKTQGIYNVFICQESWRKYATDESFQNSNSRLIIMKEGKDSTLTFIGAKNLMQEQICNFIDITRSWSICPKRQSFLEKLG
jgi:hypothetical protein